ncbi:MAG TPA: hypothetical protein PLN31_08240 [Azoarcus taiwanensis]|nr:hypothetical protein [Azoarcus taiwanensis]
MPSTHVPILTLSGQCEPSTSDYLINMINAIARSAFGRPINCSAAHLGQQTHHSVLLSLPPLAEHEDSLELALRLGEALFRELGSLCQDLGVRFKHGAPPSRPALQITGLTRHQLRLKFVTFLAKIESQTQLELQSSQSPMSIRLWAGGATRTASNYLCEEIVRWRSTSRGDVIRIRVGKRLMSIALPVDCSAKHIRQGSLISTAPIVGLVTKRVVQAARCQFSIFD